MLAPACTSGPLFRNNTAAAYGAIVASGPVQLIVVPPVLKCVLRLLACPYETLFHALANGARLAKKSACCDTLAHVVLATLSRSILLPES